MARAGRKRKIWVRRDPCGEISKEHKAASKAQSDRMITYAANAKRAQMIVTHLLKDQRFGTKLGDMLLLGNPRGISAQLYAAGEFAQRAFEAYDRIVLGVSRTPKAANLLGTGGASLREDPDDATVERVTGRVMKIEAALAGAPNGRAICDATKALLRNEALTEGRIDLAIEGLKVLAKTFRIDDVSDADLRKRAKRHRFIGEENLAEALALE